MGFAAFAFLVVFLLIASGGLLLFYREAMIQRVSEVISPRRKPAGMSGVMHQTGVLLSATIERVEHLLPKSAAEVSIVQQRLIRAGYREGSAVNTFYSAKLLLPVFLCFLALATNLWRHNPFFIFVLALALGFLVPDFWLGRRIKKRQSLILRGLPDMLDLLVICVEAGLSLDQSTVRTADELRPTHPAISDELGMVILEQRGGRPRAEAWKHLAERTGVDNVRNLVAIMVQSEQFGTSVAKTLRVHADTTRTQRRQNIEEQAAKTTVKLVFPLVFFIFPSLFLVTLGPAVIIMVESFHKYLIH